MRRARTALTFLAVLAAAPAHGQENPGDTCAGFFECAKGCSADDQACLDGCLPTDSGQVALLDDLVACVDAHCRTVPSEELQSCVDQSCGGQVTACIGNGIGGTGESCPDGLSFEGECVSDVVRWCENDELHVLDCGAQASTCGFNDTAGFYDCMAGGEACGEVTYEGECQGNVAVWCENGVLTGQDCDEVGLACGADSAGIYYCYDGGAGAAGSAGGGAGATGSSGGGAAASSGTTVDPAGGGSSKAKAGTSAAEPTGACTTSAGPPLPLAALLVLLLAVRRRRLT